LVEKIDINNFLELFKIDPANIEIILKLCKQVINQIEDKIRIDLK
jgi:hypothetical protein